MINKYFFNFIRSQYCILCGKFDAWNDIDSKPVNTISHVKTRGSGGEDFNNCVPMCTFCHIKFEQWPYSQKQKYLIHAKALTSRFLRGSNVD